MYLPQELLGKLIGDWKLSGQMGEIPLQQAVTAYWVLGGLFVEMKFKSTLAESPYEALYLVGFNKGEDKFVLHLFDTFGVSTKAYPGLGIQERNSIAFVFDYPDGLFNNRFTWKEETQIWEFEQSFIQDGEAKIFATKKMVKK